MKTPRAYSALNAVAVILTVVGALALLGHLAGQIREGHASEASLVGGLGALVLGILFLVLADLGARAARIEAKLGTKPSDTLPESEAPPSVESMS